MKEKALQRTRWAFIATSLLSAPLLAGDNFAKVILVKEFDGSALQVTLLTMLRPLVALVALYWSAFIAGRSERLLPSLVWTGVLARIPFFLCFFLQSSWGFITVLGLYMLLSRAGIPAWMEIFRLNLSREVQGKVFSRGSSLGYVEGLILTLLMGMALDEDQTAWRWIFFASALVGLASIWFQSRIPLDVTRASCPGNLAMQNFQGKMPWLLHPWISAWKLMREKPDFRWFQWGFMGAGSAMMIIQPALPFFFVDSLGVSYTELAIAMAICKGIGFSLTSPAWAKWWKHCNLFCFAMLIFGTVAFFPLLLMLAPTSIWFLYLAYLMYGIGQAGSEMCWHLSGSVFAKDQDSSVYTGVNVAMVGVRGAIIPPIGAYLCTAFGSFVVFSLSSALCLFSAALLLYAYLNVEEGSQAVPA